MVSKYDVFISIAKKGLIELKELPYSNKDYFIKHLEKEKLVIKKSSKILINNILKTKKIFSILMFCLNNDLDYNFYTNKTTLTFLHEYFNNKKKSLSTNTLTKIRKKLQKDSFLILFSKKPLDFVILNHIFFKELFDYFNFKYKEKELPKQKIIEKISKIKIKRSIKEKTSFIHSSLQLEGNLLTLRQTQKVLKNELLKEEIKPKDVLETINYNNGLNYLEKIKELTLENILYLHGLIMNHEEFSGKIREENVIIKGNPKFKIRDYKNIKKELNKLLEKNINIRTKNLFELCKQISYIHNQFQYIHPFIDGNSRLTRLITYFLFKKNNILFDVPIGFTTLYVKSTKGYEKRDDDKLAILFALILIKIAEKD